MDAVVALPGLPLVSGVAFRLIDRFPGYCVGNDGSVWSCRSRVVLPNRGGSRAAIGDRWKKLKATATNHGYSRVTLRRDGDRFDRFVHVLVLTAFVGSCPAGMEGAHGNGKQSDNRLENLRWATRADNHADKIRHGTQTRGIGHPYAKLTESQVTAIRASHQSGMSNAAIARQYGLHRSTVRAVVTGRAWKHIPLTPSKKAKVLSE